ncbi:MAG: LL-diaminopimelate aminotransferase [bacterium]|nr:LL-diaminopimelate aminotransferase [bacterium]
MTFTFAQRLQQLPPYLFAEIDKIKRAVMAEGRDVINLGVGDPDMPTPSHIVAALQAAATNPANHQYALDQGKPALRRAAAAMYQRRFGVALDPDAHVLPLLGSKEGIGHIHLAFVNPGDIVLVPEPGYPVYHSGTLFAGGSTYWMPLKKENNYLPDLTAIPSDVARRARMMFICYPNNPTAVTAPLSFFQDVVAFARSFDILVCHDAAYCDVYYDGQKPPSFLQAHGAIEVGIEYYSLSKTYNMTGWRVAFAVGNPDMLAGLAKVKSNLDSGIFGAVQDAAIVALNGPQDCHAHILATYQERRDLLVSGLRACGCPVDPPQGAFYVWVPVPPGMTSTETTLRLLQDAAIVTTPGIGFGPSGEGYFRMTLTAPADRLREAVKRIAALHLYG